MAQLMVRNVDDAVVREILEHALLRPRRRSLAEVLAAMPHAGEDADFERRQIDGRG